MGGAFGLQRAEPAAKGEEVLKIKPYSDANDANVGNNSFENFTTKDVAPVAINQGGKVWGFIKKDGSWAVKPKYLFDDDDEFTFEYRNNTVQAKDAKTELIGFIGPDGNWVVQPQFDDIDWEEQDDKSWVPASIKKGKRELWGWIDKTGKWVIKPKYTGVSGFSDGKAEVEIETPDKGGYAGRTYQYKINRKGKRVGKTSWY